MKIADQLENFWLVYSNLCDLRKSYVFYEMVKEDIYDVNSLEDYFIVLNNIFSVSENTKSLMSAFQEKFDDFIRSKNYSSDRAFVYLDPSFISLLDHELKDFLESLNADLLAAGFTDVESLEVKERESPSNELILERVSILFEMTEKKNRFIF
ncbi:hypothetical protein ACFCT7_00635 [Fulvivirgaceae bacterium LMO-SS25]